MRTILLLAMLASGSAHAEDRRLVVTVGAGAGGSNLSADGGSNNLDASNSANGIGIGQLTLAWEHTPLALPATKGYALAAALVPELVAGGLVASDRAAGFIGAGLRAELQMSQRNLGLFEITARGAVYLVGRGIVAGDRREPLIEVGVGEYFTSKRTWTRIGWEADLIVPPGSSEQMNDPFGQTMVLVQLFVGAAP